MFTPRSSAPLSDILHKVALIGPADPSDTNQPPPNFRFHKYRFVLHPAYSLNSPAVGIEQLPFDPSKRTHNFYTDPVARRFPAYGGLWLAGSAPISFSGRESHLFVVVQSRDWVLTFVGATLGIALIILVVTIIKRARKAGKALSR
ncbi:MAG: hypothetical protein ACXW3Z_05765 [Limisphaerales bacterium]